MTNNENEMRSQFEVFARGRGLDLEYRNIPGSGQYYWCPRTYLAFEAWQASRQALAVDLPSVQCIRINDYTAEETREACRRAIEPQGVKCK